MERLKEKKKMYACLKATRLSIYIHVISFYLVNEVKGISQEWRRVLNFKETLEENNKEYMYV